MIRQYLLNKNENATVLKSKKKFGSKQGLNHKIAIGPVWIL